jgi:hypothetical protein
MKLDKNKKIVIGVGILGLLAFILYKKGVFGGEVEETEVVEETLKSSMPDNTPLKSSPVIPIVSSGSETPQVVNIPAQFGNQTAVVNKLPSGSFQTFN